MLFFDNPYQVYLTDLLVVSPLLLHFVRFAVDFATANPKISRHSD